MEREGASAPAKIIGFTLTSVQLQQLQESCPASGIGLTEDAKLHGFRGLGEAELGDVRNNMAQARTNPRGLWTWLRRGASPPSDSTGLGTLMTSVMFSMEVLMARGLGGALLHRIVH